MVLLKRKKQTLLTATRSMLATSKMRHRFWEDAVATTCYLQNRTPHRALQGAILFTLWYGQSSNVSHLKVFGAIAYSYIQSKNRSKLESHCTRGRFIGYGDSYGVKAYKIISHGKLCLVDLSSLMKNLLFVVRLENQRPHPLRAPRVTSFNTWQPQRKKK